ncbi:MAG: hypothetical protein AAGA77_15775, partial [Bacteroidota bacterium]
MIKKIVAYFIGGVALVAPLAITAWVLYSAYNWIVSYYDIEHALIGLFLLLISLVVIGYMASSFMGARAFFIIETL